MSMPITFKEASEKCPVLHKAMTFARDANVNNMLAADTECTPTIELLREAYQRGHDDAVLALRMTVRHIANKLASAEADNA